MRSAALALPPVQAPPSAALAAALAKALATGRHPLAPHHSDSPYRGSPTERHASGLPAAPSPPTALRRTWKGGGGGRTRKGEVQTERENIDERNHP